MKRVKQGVASKITQSNALPQTVPEERDSIEKEKKMIRALVASGLIAKGPLSPFELVECLKIRAEDYEALKEVLHSMILDRSINLSSDDRFFFQGPLECEGRISIHSRGFGFVSIEGWTQDIFIPKCYTEGSCNRDLVRIVVTTKGEKQTEGRVLSILKRGQIEVVGTITSILRQKGLAYSSMLQGQYIQVKVPKPNQVVIGDRILIQMTKWGDQNLEGEGTLVRKLGHITDASKDTEVALAERSIRCVFPEDVLAEAEAIYKKGIVIDGREDFKSWETITIDPITAKDFDDALSIQKNRFGGYRLGVHIADVANYVTQNTALDREARLRGNSTYFINCCIPMLPNALADNLCSLQAGVPRLTVSIIMNFDAEGELLNNKIVRSVIESKEQLSYERAKEILDKGKEESPRFNQLKMMVDLCLLLKKQRKARGAVDMNLDEIKIVCNEKGETTSLQRIPYDITHQMVEEFMVKANEIVALHLSEIDTPTIYRSHESPSEESFKDFLAQAQAFNFSIKKVENESEVDVSALLEEASHTPFGRILTIEYIRSMKMAFYQINNIGHFGLRLKHYCHFTSPIRRYSDLIVIRSLFGKTESIASLQEIAKFISNSERTSAKAEQSVLHLKKLRLLYRLFTEGKTTFFSRISKVRSSGLILDLLDLSFEVFLHVSQVSKDFLTFDENSLLLSSRTGAIYKAGDTMEIELLSIDLLTQKTRWKGAVHYSLDLPRTDSNNSTGSIPPIRKKNPRRHSYGSR